MLPKDPGLALSAAVAAVDPPPAGAPAAAVPDPAAEDVAEASAAVGALPDEGSVGFEDVLGLVEGASVLTPPAAEGCCCGLGAPPAGC